MSLSTSIISSLVYAPGAFFFFPWKPAVQAYIGDTYEVGYKFFRRDHSEPTNVCLHLVALAWQLLGNFGVLTTLDAKMFGDNTLLSQIRPLSALTAMQWAALLVMSPAPHAVSTLSVLAIIGAYLSAPNLSPHGLELGCTVAFVAVLTLTQAFRGKRLKHQLQSMATTAGYFGIAFTASRGAAHWRGTFADDSSTRLINIALFVLMSVLGMLPKPTVPCVFGGVLAVRIAGELTTQDALLFWGAAWVAQLSQGIAHKVSRQEATLLSHEESTAHGRRTKLAFEVSHVCYFPNLLLHACYEDLVAGTSFAATSKKVKGAKRA